MNKINYRIVLDAHKGGIQKTLHGFFAGDVLSRRIVISLVAGSTPYVFGENTAAVMYVTKPNGETSYNACTIEDNVIFYDVLQTDVDAEGITTMQVKVMTGDTVLHAPMFAVEAQSAMASDEQAIATPTFTALETALVKAETVYNERLVSIDIAEDLIFTATYANGNTYVSTALKDAYSTLKDVSDAEDLRVKAEKERIDAEQKRVQAENVRLQAEEKRVQEYTVLKDSIEDSAEKAIALQDDVADIANRALLAADGSAVSVKAPKLNADTVGGYSIDDIKAYVDAEIQKHLI